MILGSLIVIIQFGNYKMKEALCDFSVSKKKTTHIIEDFFIEICHSCCQQPFLFLCIPDGY